MRLWRIGCLCALVWAAVALTTHAGAERVVYAEIPSCVVTQGGWRDAGQGWAYRPDGANGLDLVAADGATWRVTPANGEDRSAAQALYHAGRLWWTVAGSGICYGWAPRRDLVRVAVWTDEPVQAILPAGRYLLVIGTRSETTLDTERLSVGVRRRMEEPIPAGARVGVIGEGGNARVGAVVADGNRVIGLRYARRNGLLQRLDRVVLPGTLMAASVQADGAAICLRAPTASAGAALQLHWWPQGASRPVFCCTLPNGAASPAQKAVVYSGQGFWWIDRSTVFRCDRDGSGWSAYLPWHEPGLLPLALLPDHQGVRVMTSLGLRRIDAVPQVTARGFDGFLMVRSREPETPAPINALLTDARGWLGTPYRYGGVGRDGVDCSGLVMNLFRERGLTLPHSAAQIGDAQDGERVMDVLMPGDTIVTPGHIALYEGAGVTIEAINQGVARSTVWRWPQAIASRFRLAQ